MTSKAAPPYQCAFDSKAFTDGDHTLMAVATDNLGLASTAQIGVRIDNGTAPAPTTKPIDALDLLGEAQAEVVFSQQKSYTAQVIGTYTSASSIPESGIQGTVLSNGETLRLGKQVDPLDSTRGSLAFQVAPSDPNTSGAKRAELSFNPMIEMDKVYWIALRVFVYDWGTLSTSDAALFGMQLHTGDNSTGLSPNIGVYTGYTGGRQFHIEWRYSTNAKPAPSNTVTVRSEHRDTPFNTWMDLVFRFQQNLSGAGFLQVWQNGEQIVDYAGNLGFYTPGYKDYAKFGYYNWSSFASSRKVLLKSPTIVADPTGSKYTAEDLRAHVRSK